MRSPFLTAGSFLLLLFPYLASLYQRVHCHNVGLIPVLKGHLFATQENLGGIESWNQYRRILTICHQLP